MSTTKALRILEFLTNNITSGIETVDEARVFVECLEDFDEAERLLLDVALHDPGTMGPAGGTQKPAGSNPAWRQSIEIEYRLPRQLRKAPDTALCPWPCGGFVTAGVAPRRGIALRRVGSVAKAVA